jgi:RNA polymerase sigma-70 factor (ECF subfamily)
MPTSGECEGPDDFSDTRGLRPGGRLRTGHDFIFSPRPAIQSGFGAELFNVSPNDPDASTLRAAPADRRGERDLNDLLIQVGRGDQSAFEAVYDRLAGPVYGVIRRVLRDPSQSEEVTQEVLLEVWRTAARFDPAVGGASTWVMTIAHRRAVDRVRSVAAAAEREQKTAGVAPQNRADDVAEAVEATLDRERVRRCLDGLTQVQRESITLAYYGGYSYRQVAGLLNCTLGAIKTRIRDGLIRMRDCLGVG